MSFANIRPSLEGFYTGWTLGAGASKPVAVDPGDPIAHDDDTSYIKVVASSAAKESFTLRARPEMAAITSIAVNARVKAIGGGTLRYDFWARLRGVDGAVVQHAMSTGGYETIGTHTLPRPGGGAWSVEDVVDPSLEICVTVSDWSTATEARVSSLWLEDTYTATPSQIEQTREIASRELLTHRRPSTMFQLGPGTLQLLDPEIGDEISVTHFAMPEASGLGAGSKRWQRRLVRLLGRDVDPKGRAVTALHVRDIRRELATFWDTGLASSPGRIANGVARWDRGSTRSYTRASKAWVEDPSSVIRELPADVEKLAADGMLLERAATNFLLNSAYRNGAVNVFTSWTAGGASGSITEDPDTLFDPLVAPRCVKFTAGNPHTADLTLTAAATGSITANTKMRLSVDHRDDSGATLAWQLTRGIDGKYFRDSDATWQAVKTTNTFAVRTSKARSLSASVIDVGAGATTLTLVLLQQSGGTASRVNRVYFSQVEDQPWASSRIVTDAVTYMRALETLTVSNNSSARAWTGAQGTAFIRLKANWDSVDVTGKSFPLLRCQFDANNIMTLFADCTAGPNLWSFFRKVAGSSFTASKSQSVTRGQFVVLAIRWTGLETELDLTAYTQDIFVDGVKGTAVASGAAPTEAGTADMTIGVDPSGAFAADGYLSHIRITQAVLTDQEIAQVSLGGW